MCRGLDRVKTSPHLSPNQAAEMPDKILVVDDEPALELLIRQKFRKKIRSNELAFLFAGDGVEALEQLGEHPEIGLVLTDINMPRMDGLTLLTKMRDLDRVIRSVVVSAYGDLKNIRTAMNRGAFDFVTKPIDFEDLQTTVDKSIGDLRLFNEASEAKHQLSALQKELDVARRIQEASLPKSFPEQENIDLYAYMIPAREVGGDFYDFFFVDESTLGFVIGDVSGKGVSAAMFMTVSRTLLKALALRSASPEQCITDLNSILYPESVAEMFVTIFYGTLDLKTGDVKYCNAGHNSPYVVRADGEVEQVPRTGGVGVCLTKHFEFEAGSLKLNAGDGIVTYTDGVTEAMNHSNQQFTDEKLVELLTDCKGCGANQMIRRIIREVSDFAEDADQSDDITALAFRYNP